MVRNKVITTLFFLQLGTPLAFGNGLSDGITASTVQNKDNVKENKQNDSNGREYKAGDAQKQGNTGAGAAIATGAALIGAAIPLLLSLEPIEVAAGADLMAKAGLEFGQAGADAGSASDNKAQKDLLTNKNAAGETGAQTTGAPTGKSINSPQLDKLLADRGINADDFKNKLASGQMTNPQDILSNMGDTTPISPDDVAAGADLANSQMGNVFQNAGDTKGNSESAAVAFNEKGDGGSAQSNSSDSGGGGGGSFSSSISSEDKGLGLSSADAIKESVLGLRGGKSASSGGGKSGSTHSAAAAGAGGGFAGFDAGAFVKNMFGSAAAATKGATEGLVRLGLESMGISVTPAKQNIFQLARRNFFSFGKWRKSVRVAAITQ